MPKNARSLLVIAAAAIAVVAVAQVAPAGGQGLPVGGVVDAAVAVESRPATVSPPGANVLYRITASNVGVVPLSSVTVTDLLPPGFTFRFAKGAPCSASGTTVTCLVGTLAPGTSKVFDIVAQTSTTAGNYGNTAMIEHSSLEPLEYRDNNTATAVTAVVNPSSTGASAFVPGGGTLTFAGQLLTVPAQQYNADRTALVPVDGVIATLSRTDNHAGFTCGAVQCAQGLRVDYDTDPSYQVTDPDHPVSVDVTFPNDPCNGLISKCGELYFKKPAMPAPSQVPNCDGAGSGGHPGTGVARVGGLYQLCTDRIYKSGGIHEVVLMVSTDPDLLPPIPRPNTGVTN